MFENDALYKPFPSNAGISECFSSENGRADRIVRGSSPCCDQGMVSASVQGKPPDGMWFQVGVHLVTLFQHRRHVPEELCSPLIVRNSRLFPNLVLLNG